MHANAFVLAAILVFVASCVTKIDEGTPIAADGEHLVTLSFTVPGAPTRAMDETTVETIDVLLFDPSTDNIVYRAIGTKPVSNQFTVKLPANTYNIVVLANARAMIPSAYPPATTGASFTNDTRTDVLAAITKSITPVSAHQWPATFDRIPMWGYSNGFVVGTSSPTISLTRMIAKIDITVGGAVADFWLANVRLYNYSTAGHVAPAALPPTTPDGNRYAGYDITQWNDIPAGIKAYAPHLPTGVKATDDYIAYNTDPSNTKDIVEYKDNIYAFETAAGILYPAAGWKQNTCLVIGGYYQSTTSPTYYRVEFVNAAAFLPLLRNHRYIVTITGVSAHGYPTPEDAYNNPPSNITVQITAWNDGGLDDITFGPQHYLAVDKSEIIFYAGGGSKSMEAITDLPAGWTIEKDAVHDWFTVSPLVHASTSQQTITVTIPNGNGPRDGHFDIVAGNLKKKIIVKQLAETEFSLSITDLAGNPLDELAFDAGNIGDGTLPVARSFRVTWFPIGEDCQVEPTSVAGMTPFTFNTSGGGIDPLTISPLTGGSETITIQPDPLAPGDPDRVSRLDFSVAHNGQYRTAVLYLRQINNYVTLDETTYSTNVAVPPPADISMTTNIPVDELTATVTGTGGLVTGEIIEAGPVLRVNFATNTLTGATFQTYTVQVKHGAQVMATLTVHVSGSGWEMIDGKLVGSIVSAHSLYMLDYPGATVCPEGSSQPRSVEDAMWYERNLTMNINWVSGVVDEDGYHNVMGVIWYGASTMTAYRIDDSIEHDVMAQCVWNQRVISPDAEHFWDLESFTVWAEGLVRYPYGTLIGHHDSANNYSVYYPTVGFRCVVW